MPKDQRKRLSAPRPVTVSAKDIEAALEAMPEKPIGVLRREFTAEEDAALLKYRPVRTWDQLCKAFGCCQDTLRRHYRELTAGK